MTEYPPRRRVVITGLGAVTPLGVGVDKTWHAVCAGQSGIGPVTRFDPSGYPCRIAAEVKDFDPADHIEKKEIKKMDTFIQYAVAASQEAVDDAGLTITPDAAERVGVYIGAGIGGLPAIEQYHKVLQDKGPGRVSPFFIPMVIVNLASGQVAIRFGAKGPNSCAVTACATGNHCIGDAYRIIQRGEADVMLAGGTESTICPLALAGFAAAKALSRRNDDPQRASCPFDRDRDGFVIGEGAGVLVLEELEHAERRGAKIYGEVVGYGATSDGYDMVAPSGEGAVRCMKLALSTVDGPVDYINTHGTSTPIGDSREIAAIREVFGEEMPHIASTKSLTGHSLGATGVQESIYSLLMMKEGFIGESAHIQALDPEFDGVPIVRERTDNARIDTVLSNSVGFGGTNATLIFRRHEG